MMTDFAALDADQQNDRVNELSGEVERQMYEVAGLAQAGVPSLGEGLLGGWSRRSSAVRRR